MVFNAEDELMDDIATTAVGPLVITWSANTPTAGLTQTIADGDLVAGTELGLAIQNMNTIISQLVADVATLKALVNA